MLVRVLSVQFIVMFKEICEFAFLYIFHSYVYFTV